jgi:hypothetical protein
MKQKRAVGKWVGEAAIDPNSGAYNLGGGESPMRIVVDSVGTAKAFTDRFGGVLQGKAEKKESLSEYTYKRLVGDKTVQITVKKSDPMQFNNIELAKGPAEIYPHSMVSGRLDYDYETGNWFTDGIRFKYSLDGNEFDFHGKARLQAKISHMATGWKSVLLKPVDPFFSKNGAGTELPVKITGTRSEPHFGLDFGRKDVKRE